MNEYFVAPLNKTQHQTEHFDCATPALNQWLRNTAGQHQDKGISRTFVLACDDTPQVIRGYYALAIRQMIATATLPIEFSKRLPREVPALTLARLAICRTLQGRGLGEFLLYDALWRAKEASNQVGGALLFVDAKEAQAAGFYAQYGFKPMPESPLTLAIALSKIT
ncbi:GNAT family N-acetyltransferase [Herbaspirillum seropedicae]|uniref:GNAT family N-acetyltransferase n=1 Tax=Herbaspirillum seropedicae TaxID=964 RepID=UPI00084813FD|nr:GNAT family N-acetyltransferase [Herbaspirillum seropedicae]AON54145.1 histone acetyltransferase HPA2 protein [Herbaspirillum seropedicae]